MEFGHSECNRVKLFALADTNDLIAMLLPGIFQSYQDDGWMIIKGCVQCNPI